MCLGLSAGTGHTQMPRLRCTPSTCTSFPLLFFLPPGTLEPTVPSPSHHPALQRTLGFLLCGSPPCQLLSLLLPGSTHLAQRPVLTLPSLMPLGSTACISRHLSAPDPQTLTPEVSTWTQRHLLHIAPSSPFCLCLPDSAWLRQLCGSKISILKTASILKCIIFLDISP